tara:strand:+ start:16020 stop:18188 length:2169 start_codon:yes stop_codon:yes gene_type:complete
MSIQEIELSNHGSSNTGFKREIDKGAMGLVLDTIQITQYTKPEESTVRELTANAVDSQREKEIAISILSGNSTPGEHFISREGDKYKDSNWDASYYDLKHLNTEKTKVELVYEQNEGVGYCDRFIVRDHGVGLGMDRLEGYFSIGYSTKRNSKGSLGAFGFGNKVALSTRCDYYTIVTVHNGKKFKFNCYSYKIDSVIGKFSGDKTNESITFKNGQEIFYEATDEKNYSEVIVPTKRHHRGKYEAAVKSQLLYFSTVNFTVIEEDKHERNMPVTAEILYNSDRLIMSRNNQFSKPHIVIVKGEKNGDGTGVCYGYVDFQEMEMEQLYGNVGVKCPIRSVIRDEDTGRETVLQEGVEVTPSRETVIWSEHTREFIKGAFKGAVEEATELVQDKLQEDDFLRWLTTCKDVLSRSSNDGVMSQLSKVVDMNGVRPAFKGTSIKYAQADRLFRGFKVRMNRSIYDRQKAKYVMDRADMQTWTDFNHERVYLKAERTSAKKDAYIHSIAGAFLTVEMMTDDELHKEYQENAVASRNLSEMLFESLLDSREELLGLIANSKDVKDYDTIEVPEDFGVEFEATEEVAAVKAMSAAQRRKAEAKISIHGLFIKRNPGYGNNAKRYKWKQHDTKIIDLQDDSATIYYGSNEDDEKLHFLGHIMDNMLKDQYDVTQGETPYYVYEDENRNLKYFNDEVKIIKISKTNERHFKGRDNCVHVNDFFQKTESING